MGRCYLENKNTCLYVRTILQCLSKTYAERVNEIHAAVDTNFGFHNSQLYIIFIIIIINIQPLGQFGQEPEPSQATGMALVRCILGKFLGVVCHCFPPNSQLFKKKSLQRFC